MRKPRQPNHPTAQEVAEAAHQQELARLQQHHERQLELYRLNYEATIDFLIKLYNELLERQRKQAP